MLLKGDDDKMNLNFASSSSTNAGAQNVAQKRVCKWVQEDARYQGIATRDPSVQLMVSEVQCFDEGCVPLETLVIVVGSASRWVGKLLLPIAEVQREHITTDLSVPRNWWLYSTLQGLRASGGGKVGYSQRELDAAYTWLEVGCAEEGGMLGALERIHGRGSTDRGEGGEDGESRTVGGGEEEGGEMTMTAPRALLLLSRAMALGRQERDGVKGVMGLIHVPAPGGGLDEKDQKADPPPSSSSPTALSAPATPPLTAAGTKPTPVYFTKAYAPPPPSAFVSSGAPPIRHDKSGVRQRGCPCCDPDSIDNYVDKLFMSNI